jgi:hypothetical protein
MNAPSAALAHLLLAGWRMQRTVLSRIESRIYNVVTFHLSRQRNDSLHVHRTCSSMYISIHPSGVASRASWIQWATLTRDQQQFCTCLYLLQAKETGRPMLMEIKTYYFRFDDLLFLGCECEGFRTAYAPSAKVWLTSSPGHGIHIHFCY